MKMENCKFERNVETVESTATNSEAMMMKKRNQLDYEESDMKKKQKSSLNYDELDKCVKYYCVSTNDLIRLRSGSGRVSVSNCAKEASRCCQIVSDCYRSVDIEVKSFETDNSTSSNNKCSRETTPVSEICENTTESRETPAKKSRASLSSRKSFNSPAVTLPSTAEIDEFFSKAEKHNQNRFAEKYNYDVVRDLPMDGWYEWTRLKP